LRLHRGEEGRCVGDCPGRRLARDGIPDALDGVSRFGGALRNVFSVVELARVLAKGAPVGLAEVNAAIEALQFGKGGK